MSDSSSLPEQSQPDVQSPPRTYVVCLSPLSDSDLTATVDHVAEAFAGANIIVASANSAGSANQHSGLTVIQGASSSASKTSFVPAAADYVNAWTFARDKKAAVIVLLGPDASSVSPLTMQRLASSVSKGRDLVVARYPVGTTDALINSSILYPFSRALFSNPLRYPLPIDVALSPKMCEVLATAGQHLTASNKSEAFIWPLAEAAFTGCSTCDVEGNDRHLPQPPDDALEEIVGTFVGSIFADAQAKAAFWQRAQLTGTSHPRDLTNFAKAAKSPRQLASPAHLIESFQKAYHDYREAWSLFLPPNSMLSLKKLSLASPDNFVLPAALWARTVYDCFLAYRLTPIPRATLFATFTPLYRAWMASHILQSNGDARRAEQLVEDGACAFENDKPYLIARWRWPDRFNP